MKYYYNKKKQAQKTLFCLAQTEEKTINKGKSNEIKRNDL